MFIFMAIIIVGIGFLNLLKPSFAWHLKEGWKVDGESEPSDSYLAMTRLSGLFAIFVGFILIITQLVG